MGRNNNFKALDSVLNSFDLAAAQRAIYMDYEGNKHAPPTLLGWSFAGRFGGRYGAAIVEPAFTTCSGRYKAKAATFVEHEVAARGLVDLARDEQRHIVSWSTHDAELICDVLDRQAREALRSRYVNAVKVARRWHHATFHCVPPAKARLAYFGRIFEITPPEAYGDKTVASNLSSLRPCFVAGLGYTDLTTQERKRWVAVVKHNQWDVRIMEVVVKRMLSGEAPSPLCTPATCG